MEVLSQLAFLAVVRIGYNQTIKIRAKNSPRFCIWFKKFVLFFVFGAFYFHLLKSYVSRSFLIFKIVVEFLYIYSLSSNIDLMNYIFIALKTFCQE